MIPRDTPGSLDGVTGRIVEKEWVLERSRNVLPRFGNPTPPEMHGRGSAVGTTSKCLCTRLLSTRLSIGGKVLTHMKKRLSRNSSTTLRSLGRINEIRSQDASLHEASLTRNFEIEPSLKAERADTNILPPGYLRTALERGRRKKMRIEQWSTKCVW